MDAFWSLSLDISNIYHNFDDNIDEYLLQYHDCIFINL